MNSCRTENFKRNKIKSYVDNTLWKNVITCHNNGSNICNATITASKKINRLSNGYNCKVVRQELLRYT